MVEAMNGMWEVSPAQPGWSQKRKILVGFAVVFVILFFLPVGRSRLDNALKEGPELTKWYAQEHVLLCLIPALFIAGGISAFVNQASVMRYLGPKADKALAYGVASLSGTILAVCSCTVLPLFGGLWKRGAGLGPATAFLYSGPAINVLAIVMTARILGIELGTARAIGAVGFSGLVGLAMHFAFRREEQAKAEAAAMPKVEVKRPLWQNGGGFAAMVGLLVFANGSKPAEPTGLWAGIFAWNWPVAGAFAAGLGVFLGLWFGFKWVKWRDLALAALPVVILNLAFPHEPLIAFIVGCAGLAALCARNPGEGREWLEAIWTLAKQIFPLFIGGVFVSAILLGRPGHEGLIPSEWVRQSMGGNSFLANLFFSLVEAFMYFSTLTEVSILQGLLGSSMGKDPALVLLLAGPALLLPSMLGLRSLMDTKKVAVYVTLVVVMATVSGLIYRALLG
jgi:uncharacterized membrane protein YraQ (UPF0718 family)